MASVAIYAIDFFCPEYDRLEPPSEVPDGFRVLGKKVVIKGICRKCGEKTRTANPGSSRRS